MTMTAPFLPLRLALAGLILVALAAVPRAGAASDITVRVTWYAPTGNPMYSGEYPYEGAAACSWNLPLGTQLRFADGRVVTCLDRGMLGGEGWVDIYCAYGAAVCNQLVEGVYGPWAVVTVLRWGFGGG